MIVDFRVTLPASEWRTEGEPGAAYMSNYGRIYTGNRGRSTSGDEMIAALGAAGVDRAVLQAEWASGDYRAMNDAVHRLVAQHPSQLVGYVTVDPARVDDLAAVVDYTSVIETYSDDPDPEMHQLVAAARDCLSELRARR